MVLYLQKEREREVVKMKYTVETLRERIAIVTDKDLATIIFEQNKDKYNYITLNKVEEIKGNTFVESIKIYRK